jgi:choline dehydrogenase-like flavoprotein
MRRAAIIVGAGAGGATAARELAGAFDVTIMEAGGEFRPLRLPFPVLETMRRTGLLLDERMIQAVYPAMRIGKTREGMVLVHGRGLGGTTTLCTANALRMDRGLQELGIRLDEEFLELERELPISTGHQRSWNADTRSLFEICREMGLSPSPMPKMIDTRRCRHCGRCVLGCPTGAKWDSRRFLADALRGGVRLLPRTRAERVVVAGGRAAGVWARSGMERRFFPADLVILAAGGMGTPAILQRSGFVCSPSLFVDPVLCVAARRKNAFQQSEIPMPFAVQRDGYILSPYFDLLSFFFNRRWRGPASDILSVMIKLADTPRAPGEPLNDRDREKLAEAVDLCSEILRRFGVAKDEIFLGTVNAGHPGGQLPLSERDAKSLHPASLPENLYVADATLLPASLGNPPSLTIMALARRIARLCMHRLSGLSKIHVVSHPASSILYGQRGLACGLREERWT